MKSVYDDYSTREELLDAASQAIEERANERGERVFRLTDPTRDALKRNVEKETRLRREAEERLATLERERATNLVELERLRAQEGGPNELRETLKRYVEQANASREKLATLEAELAPLREENAAYKARETRETIEKQLVEAARKARCVETALRDVKRLAPMFRLDDAGIATTQDGRVVEDVLREELALSPHWLDRSQGANAKEGGSTFYADDRERFERALRANNLAEAIRFAPRER